MDAYRLNAVETGLGLRLQKIVAGGFLNQVCMWRDVKKKFMSSIPVSYVFSMFLGLVEHTYVSRKYVECMK